MHRLTFRQGIAPLCAALILGACRSPQISLVAPPPPPPVTPVAVAPAVPLSQVLDLHRMVESQLENYYAKRADRLGRAVEPEERGLFVQLHSNRLDKDFTPLEAFFNAGEELFEFEFTLGEGLGNGMGAKPPNMRRVHRGAQGGPDTTSCRSCHHRGGDDGAGEYTEAALTGGDGENVMNANERNAPALLGGGALQLLAREISEALAAQAAPVKGVEGERRLEVQGVDFGTVRMRKDGTLDTSRLTAIDPDLIVRPFGWKGDTATLRDAVEQALQKNLGVQPESWITDPRRRGEVGLLGDGARADDPDGDGVTREATEGMVTALVTYLAALGPPIEEMPEEASYVVMASRGAELFGKLGCAGCHVPELPLSGTVIGLGPTERAGPRLDLTPLLSTPGKGGRMAGVRLYSDLKRHDMGDSLAEPRDIHHGVSRRLWLTPPLWGVAASAPYLHDGRASTVDQAILAHDGEGRPSRDAYEKLSTEEQGAVNLFLSVLDRPHHLEFRR